MGFIADLWTADKAADAQKDTSRDQIKASTEATDKTLALQKEMFDKIWGGTQVQRDAGDAATRMMAQLMGLSLPAQTPTAPKAGQPQVLPGQPQGSSPLTITKTIGNALAMRMGEPGMSDFGGLTSGRTGQTQTPGNALNPTGPFAPTQTPGGQAVPGSTPAAAPFDPTAWLRSTPGYEMNFKEGARALNAGLASSGKLFSGDAGREAIRYGQGYADRIYGDQFNRLASIAGAGQTATSQGSQAGQNYANTSGNALMRNADNLGSSYQNRGNAISDFWGGVSGSVNNAQNMALKMWGGF
jgi:hypothetical protein